MKSKRRKELEQLSADGLGVAELPKSKLNRIGKRTKPAPISQGEIFNPGKISPGNLPQDQEEIDL